MGIEEGVTGGEDMSLEGLRKSLVSTVEASVGNKSQGPCDSSLAG